MIHQDSYLLFSKKPLCCGSTLTMQWYDHRNLLSRMLTNTKNTPSLMLHPPSSNMISKASTQCWLLNDFRVLLSELASMRTMLTLNSYLCWQGSYCFESMFFSAWTTFISLETFLNRVGKLEISSFCLLYWTCCCISMERLCSLTCLCSMQ
jgi:hypothetical protein